MIKILIKYSYYIISFLFLFGLVLIAFVRQKIENELYIMLINYYFWYSFGLFSGAFIARIIIENYTKMAKNEKLKGGV
jgi:hypothetical protein